MVLATFVAVVQLTAFVREDSMHFHSRKVIIMRLQKECFCSNAYHIVTKRNTQAIVDNPRVRYCAVGLAKRVAPSLFALLP